MIIIFILLCINLIFLFIMNKKLNYIQDKVIDSGNKIELMWNDYLRFKRPDYSPIVTMRFSE